MVKKDKAAVQCRLQTHLSQKKHGEEDDVRWILGKKLIYHETPFRLGEIITIDAFKMEICDELMRRKLHGIIEIDHRIFFPKFRLMRETRYNLQRKKRRICGFITPRASLVHLSSIWIFEHLSLRFFSSSLFSVQRQFPISKFTQMCLAATCVLIHSAKPNRRKIQ